MTEAMSFLLGLAAGLVNQATVWLAVVRLGNRGKKAALTEFLGGLSLRFLIDGLAIYASWRLWGKPVALILTASGLLAASALSVGWGVSVRNRRAWRGGGGS